MNRSLKEDGIAYLETHHLIPLFQGGEDKIDNVCTVCPNCNRELHFGTDKLTLKKKIIKSMFNIII
jgi:5-methylcytosine-specific restriction protein A